MAASCLINNCACFGSGYCKTTSYDNDQRNEILRYHDHSCSTYERFLLCLATRINANDFKTPLSAVKNAIEWYLRPIPFIPEVRIAMVVNL